MNKSTRAKKTPLPKPLAFEQKARTALAHFDAAESFLIGVSGGRDSVALLHFLVSCGFKNLVVCHLDHSLRGRASSADARFVANLAEKYNLRSVVKKYDVRKFAAKKKQSLETAARDARYAFFARVSVEEKCNGVFLAHHADDQVETFLFNLFRGAGTFGLGGMQAETVRNTDGATLHLLRPLLGIWRAEIDEYIHTHKLKFRDDATNRELQNTRSKMRCEIIPAIEKALGRDVRKSIWKTAEILRAQQEFLRQSICVDSAELSVSELRAMPDALQSALIHQWLQKNGVPDISFDLVQSVRALIDPATTHAKVNLPGARHVRRRAKKLFVE